MLKRKSWFQTVGKIVATPTDFCDVSTPTVSKYRKRLQEEGLLPEIQERTDKSGRKLNTGNLGTKANHKEKILKIASEMDREEVEEIIDLLEALL